MSNPPSKIRITLSSSIPASSKSQITSFNPVAAKISPFLFVNLMLLFILHLIFLFFYLSLKIYEIIRIHKFKKETKNTPRKSLGSLRNAPNKKEKDKKKKHNNSLSKFDFFVFRVLRKIDIDVPLYAVLLFLVPLVVFACINFKYASDTTHSLFLASTVFSVLYMLLGIQHPPIINI